MKTIILIILILSFKCFKETNNSIMPCALKWDPLLKIKVYTEADRMPEYPGGNQAFNLFFLKNYHLSSEKDFQGTLKLEFVIDVKGNLIGERILNKENATISVAEKEALRVLRKMPRWRPGICKSKTIPVKVSFPIHF